jgi:hypothetical protein
MLILANLGDCNCIFTAEKIHWPLQQISTLLYVPKSWQPVMILIMVFSEFLHVCALVCYETRCGVLHSSQYDCEATDNNFLLLKPGHVSWIMTLIGGAPRSHFNLSAMPAARHKRVGDLRTLLTVTELNRRIARRQISTNFDFWNTRDCDTKIENFSTVKFTARMTFPYRFCVWRHRFV